jgi:hypothetical protein
LFALTSVGCFLIAQQVPFNAEEVLWDMRQPLRLLEIYLLLALPFFFAANAIALALIYFRQHMSRIYGADLFGAGIGSMGVIVLMYQVMPMSVLTVLCALGIISTAVGAWELRLPRQVLLTSLALAMAIPVTVSLYQPGLTISPYKSLPQTLRIHGTHIIHEQASPLGQLTVVKSDQLPIRYAPGLSMQAKSEPLSQLAVFTDADNMSVITQGAGDRRQLAYLDQMISAAPYHLRKPREVLILGAGGGSDILQAQYHQTGHIDAVELNHQMIELVRDRYGEFAGDLYRSDNLAMHTDEVRGFLSKGDKHYDIIQLALMDAFSASSAGLYALNESYLYTTEALGLFIERLQANGFLAISRWIKVPPRDALKLFTTTLDALHRAGVAHPEMQLMLIRNWQISTLIVKNGEVTPDDIDSLKHFCDERSFDLAYYPGMPPEQANRFNVLREAYFYNGTMAISGVERAQYLEQYKFDLTPASDDRPYFFHFFKWAALPEILSLRGRGGMPLLEWGYLVLVFTLLQAMLASLVLILLPLWLVYRHRSGDRDVSEPRLRVLIYFFAVGLAFLFVEMAFIQRFIQFLHHPVYAIAVVLSTFLIFAGLGSTWSRHHADSNRHQRGTARAVMTIILLGGFYLLVLEPLFQWLTPLPTGFKIAITIVLIAPLAFTMGMPFPLALNVVGQQAPRLLPWAWAVNGCASVLSAVLATLLAIHLGFSVVVILALILYGIALASFPRSGVTS